MRFVLRRWALSAILIATFCVLAGASHARADAVSVQYSRGVTELDTLQVGVKLFLYQPFNLLDMPDRLAGLQFTRRPWRNQNSSLDITIPANTSVYILVGDTHPAASDQLDAGWQHLDDAHYSYKGNSVLHIFEKDFVQPTELHLIATGPAGAIVATSAIQIIPPPEPAVRTIRPPVQTPQDLASPPSLPERVPIQAAPDATWESSDNSPDNAHPLKTEASIKALYMTEPDSEGMLGNAADLILTVTPRTDWHGYVRVRFTSSASAEMYLVLEDDLRAVRQKYPQLTGAKEIDFNFADKHTPRDGNSVGAAVGTLLRSMIEGFDIDQNVAIAGDVSADGKVRSVGGIAAKLKSAGDAGCKIVAAPSSNEDQVLDAMIYDGPAAVANVQVIGIDNLDDAVAVARMDRDPALVKAMVLFSDFQQKMHTNPHYFSAPDAAIQLQKVLDLAPNHLSAKLLLGLTTHHQRTHLTVPTSLYYCDFIADPVLPRDSSDQIRRVDPTDLDSSIAQLQKLRPIADRKTQAYIDSVREYVQGLGDYQQHQISLDDLRSREQDCIRERSKLAEDDKAVQQMLKEGV